jgi:phosphate:Na+ symporter
MESSAVMINLFGAVALLLFGLAQVKEGVSHAFGTRLRTGLARGTKTGMRSFLSGFVATIALQSSTATSLMVSSFVERDLIKPRMAQIVLLGANVGTAVTAWLVASGIEWLSPVIILVGISLYRSRSTARKGAGTALIGIGLMLLSLHLLGAATEPMRLSPALAAFIGLLDNAWPVALAFSAAIAMVSSSSLAAIVLILSLASSGILSPDLTIVLVLGANLGGAVPPVLASLTGTPSAKRVTIGNLIVRATGCLVMLPLAGYAGELLEFLAIVPAKLSVDAHLAFNLTLACLAWPLSRPLSRLLRNIIPDASQAEAGATYLDERSLSTPMMAVTCATRETLAIGDLVDQMLAQVADAFECNDVAKLKHIPSLENQIDTLQQGVKIYLSKLGNEGLAKEVYSRSATIIDYAINLEHIADIIETGLVSQIAKKASLGLEFSMDGHQELSKLFHLTIDNLRIAQTTFATRDFNLAKQMMAIKVEVRRMEKRSSECHIERLRAGRADSQQTSSLHLDMLRDLKRINAHIVSVAHPILDDSGLLIESRLREVA